MAQRRIYFYSPNRAAHIPLVWGSLRAYADQFEDIVAAYSWERPFFLLEHKDTAIEEIEDPAVLLLSCYIWNMNKNLRLAAAVKQRWPGVWIIAGGPQVPNDAITWMRAHPYIDFAIRGEGELPCQRLLSSFLADEPDFAGIPGISYRDPETGEPRHNDGREQLPKSIESPSPFLAGYFDEAIEHARESGHAPIVLWETNRGCPYRCTFCDWGSSTMSKIRKFELSRLEAEIDYFSEHRVDAVICCDANFGILKRDIDLAERLVQRKRETGYPHKFITNYAKNPNHGVLEISRLFVRNGMQHGTIFAMQSANSGVLDAIKRSNIPFEGYQDLATKFHGEGIETYTELIIGLPRETRATWVKGVCDVLASGIHDNVMCYECVLLPNAELGSPASREQFGIISVTRPYLLDDIEQLEIVVGHSDMPSVDWIFCTLFGAIVQGLHNSGLTPMLAKYLHYEGILDYAGFYERLLERALARPQTVLGGAFARLQKLLEDYLVDERIPSEDKVLSQPDMMEFLHSVVPEKHDWLLHEWVWAKAQLDLPHFYDEVGEFLREQGVEMSPPLLDLLAFQRDQVHRIGTKAGPKVGIYQYDWLAYFRDEGHPLTPKLTITEFASPSRVMR